MIALPIVLRELLVQSRNPATVRIRTAFALIPGGVACLILGLLNRHQDAQEVLLWLNSSLAIGWCLLSGALLTADCLGGERREGTLGLLFLTDLTRLDIVLGKLAATALQAGFGLLAMMPILALPLLMGGVTPGQFWRLVLVLLSTQFASLSLGVWVSSRTMDARTAISRVLAILVFQTAGLALLGWILRAIPVSGAPAAATLLNTLNPLETFDLALRRRPAGLPMPAEYGWGIAALFASGILCLVGAILRLPRLLRESAEPVPPAPRARRQWRPSAATGSPYAWLVARHPRRDALGWIFIAGCLAGTTFFGASLLSFGTSAKTGYIIAFLIAYGLHVLVKLRTVLDATRQLSEDAGSGGLELLLTTPLPPLAILQGAVSGVWMRCRRSMGILTALNLLLWLQIFREDLHVDRDVEVFAFSMLFLGGIVLLWLDVGALIPLGLVAALRHRRPLRAATVTAAWILVPGWLGMLLVFLSAVTSSTGDLIGILILAWWGSQVLLSLLIRNGARRNLEAFRELAAGDVIATGPLWRPARPVSPGSVSPAPRGAP